MAKKIAKSRSVRAAVLAGDLPRLIRGAAL